MKKRWLWLIVPVTIIVTVFIYFNIEEVVQDKIAEKEPIPPVMEYGIPVDSFSVETEVVKHNQTLASILYDKDFSNSQIYELTQKAAGVIDLRKIKAGNILKFYTTTDSSEHLSYMVYEQSPIDYVRFTFGDSITVQKSQREVVTVKRIARGSISTSLWETMVNDSIPAALALDLSDIYAWTIDFFALQQGDSFEAIYDELYVGNKSIGIGKIYGAKFIHHGDTILAIDFPQDSVDNYWDELGHNLRKAFLKAPLRFSHITSRFSMRRFHPILHIYRPHTGVDYAAPIGTPVLSIGDGTVIGKGYSIGSGNYVKIRHNSTYTTAYNHFSRFGKDIAVGRRVSQGQIIGYVGKTGYATGPHLDFRVWKNGSPVNPLTVKSPPVEPLRSENMAAFDAHRDSVLAELDGKIKVGTDTLRTLVKNPSAPR
ncbi:MAG TPA: peptidoglycan DD-metalloendopeptidase family protein [Williamwhitmania sp.]|nr:peptidoglycan DD-metalloendopeptidase family protein [Williamwhitmania sp.]